MSSVNTEVLIRGLKAHFATPEMVSMIDDLQSGGVLNKVSVGTALLAEGIEAVELLAESLTGVSGDEKKKTLVKFLDDAIELPFYAEWFDGPIIERLIDGLVARYNSKLGHDWIKKIKDFLL